MEKLQRTKQFRFTLIMSTIITFTALAGAFLELVLPSSQTGVLVWVSMGMSAFSFLMVGQIIKDVYKQKEPKKQ